MLFGAAVVIGGMVMINRLIGPRNPGPKAKGEAFECGNPSTGSAWGRFSVRFYLTAILFLVFDVEIVFLYPWAVNYRSMVRHNAGLALGSMACFMLILFIGYIYALKKDAFDWKH